MNKIYKSLTEPLTDKTVEEPFSALPGFLKQLDYLNVSIDDILNLDEPSLHNRKKHLEADIINICNRLDDIAQEKSKKRDQMYWHYNQHERSFQNDIQVFKAKHSKSPDAATVAEIEENNFHHIEHASQLESDALKIEERYHNYLSDNLHVLVRFYVLRLREYEFNSGRNIQKLRKPLISKPRNEIDRKARERSKDIKEHYKDEILVIIKEHPNSTLQQIFNKLVQKEGIKKPSVSTIGRIIKNKPKN